MSLPSAACAHVLGRSVMSDSATSWSVTRQAPLSMGFPRQEYWSGVPCPPPGDLSDPGSEPGSPPLPGGFFTTSATWEAPLQPTHVLEEELLWRRVSRTYLQSPPSSPPFWALQNLVLGRTHWWRGNITECVVRVPDINPRFSRSCLQRTLISSSTNGRGKYTSPWIAWRMKSSWRIWKFSYLKLGNYMVSWLVFICLLKAMNHSRFKYGYKLI